MLQFIICSLLGFGEGYFVGVRCVVCLVSNEHDCWYSIISLLGFHDFLIEVRDLLDRGLACGIENEEHAVGTRNVEILPTQVKIFKYRFNCGS